MKGVKVLRRWQTNKLTDYQLFLKVCSVSDSAVARDAFAVAKRAFLETRDFYASDRRTLRQVLLDNLSAEDFYRSFDLRRP